MLINWILNVLVLSASVLIVTYILPAVKVKGCSTALVVALVYGIFKFLFTGILVFLSLPFIILTLGLFYFVINAFLLWITNKLVEGFEIEGFLNTLFAAVLISIIETVIRFFIPTF